LAVRLRFPVGQSAGGRRGCSKKEKGEEGKGESTTDGELAIFYLSRPFFAKASKKEGGRPFGSSLQILYAQSLEDSKKKKKGREREGPLP